MENEIWKDISGYEGQYQISNYKRIRNIKFSSPRILSPTKYGYGYYKIQLSKNGVAKSFNMHRLLAEAFIPNPNNLPCVDHIIPVSDGGTDDLWNLRWVTVKENNSSENCFKNRSEGQKKVSNKKQKSMLGKNTKQLLKIDNFGNIVEKYNSVKYACEKLGFKAKTIYTAISKKVKAYGFYWGTL